MEPAAGRGRDQVRDRARDRLEALLRLVHPGDSGVPEQPYDGSICGDPPRLMELAAEYLGGSEETTSQRLIYHRH